MLTFRSLDAGLTCATRSVGLAGTTRSGGPVEGTAPVQSIVEIVDIVGCTFKGNAFLLGPKIGADSRIRVQDKVHGSIILRRADQPGTPVKKWNAKVEQNPGFQLGQR